MHRHEFLKSLHAVSNPRTYFEVGTNDGRSLTLSRVPSVAVDPAFKVVTELRCDLHMVRATSDDFFAREDPFAHLGGRKIDLAFIDGMHLFDFALRDFINAERYLDPSSVVVFDDMLPRNVDEAARDRHTMAWTGDVYKIIPVLQRYRPDLRLILVDTEPTGVLVVLGVDPTNTVLRDRYDEIIDTYVVSDPQQVPASILGRTSALPPEKVLEAGFWPTLVAGRSGAAPMDPGAVGALVDEALGVTDRELATWQPDPSVAAAQPPAPAASAPVPGGSGSPGIAGRIVTNPTVLRWGKRGADRLPPRWRQAIRSRVREMSRR